MIFSKFERRETLIDAVRITKQNMVDVCAAVGHDILTKKSPATGEEYQCILLDRRKSRSGNRQIAYVGDWFTRALDDKSKFRVYGSKDFRERFIVPEEL